MPNAAVNSSPAIVYLVCEVGIENHRVCSVFTTSETAEVERSYCEHMARALDRYPEEYIVEEHRADVPQSAMMVRVKPLTADSGILVANACHFDPHCRAELGKIRWYDEVWDDGTFADVWARTLSEGVQCIEDVYRERRWALRHLETWPAFATQVTA